jgi:hypothetical protein
MSANVFLITPTSSPTLGEEWSRLSPFERLAKLGEQDAGLDQMLRERLKGMTLEYLGGVRSWTLQAKDGVSAEDIRRLIGNLPVEVADDMTFYSQ